MDGAAAGVVEAKKEGETLTGVEIQTEKYSEGVPDAMFPPRATPAISVSEHRHRDALHEPP